MSTKCMKCDKCSKVISVPKFNKNEKICECGGISKYDPSAKISAPATTPTPTPTPTPPQPPKVKHDAALPSNASVVVVNDTNIITAPKEVVEIKFTEKQRVKVIPHEFLIYGIKGTEDGFKGTFDKDLGYNKDYKDNILRIRKERGGIYNILMRYVIADD